MMSNFLVVIQIQLPLLQNRDELKQKGDKASNFSAKFYYFSLSKGNVPVETFLKEFWRTKVPPRIACFRWTMVHEAVLTPDNPKKKGWIL